jgi:hypothetical protein
VKKTTIFLDREIRPETTVKSTSITPQRYTHKVEYEAGFKTDTTMRREDVTKVTFASERMTALARCLMKTKNFSTTPAMENV